MTQTKIEPEAKKDFSRWLVVSDIDGTLNNKLRRLPKRNLEAITHFVCDLGGHFTLARGGMSYRSKSILTACQLHLRLQLL